jgi:hypothetical protein
MTRNTFCSRVYFAIVECAILALAVVLLYWYAQSLQPVIDFIEPPGYRVLEVGIDYVEVQWQKAALVTDCPGRVEPTILGEAATHFMEPYPFIVERARRTFVRRYSIPHYFPSGFYTLRIKMVSTCNPLFDGIQIIRVPFKFERLWQDTEERAEASRRVHEAMHLKSMP